MAAEADVAGDGPAGRPIARAPVEHVATRGSITWLWARHRTLVLYAVIGVTGVLLDMVLFFVLFNIAHLGYEAANLISTSTGITNNFIWNALVNFRKSDRLLIRFVRFYLVGISGLLLTAFLLWFFAAVLGIDANIVKVGSLPAVLVLQYWLNKRWSFR